MKNEKKNKIGTNAPNKPTKKEKIIDNIRFRESIKRLCFCGAECRIRTDDLLFTRQLLYRAELIRLNCCSNYLER